MSMIVIATLLCDRKASSELIGLPAMLRLTAPDGVELCYYVNYETTSPGLWSASQELLAKSGRRYEYDFWRRDSSHWRRYEQDQSTSRLEPICIARNMARSYAAGHRASHLMFIDADVVVKPDGLQRLLALNHPLVGGYVPGRGAHNWNMYVFGERWRRDTLIGCAHGTLGYSLIAQSLIEVIPFREGPHPTHRDVWLSEDPAFAADAERHGCADWIIDTTITAEHWDDPARPMNAREATEGGHAT